MAIEEQQYLPDGAVYIVAEESDDVIDDYNVEYSYTERFRRMQIVL